MAAQRMDVDLATPPSGSELLIGDESVRRSATLADQVYAIIARGLLMGAWGPDERISVPGLAQDLSVSVTPVREAMTRLVNEGALLIGDGRGFRTVRLFREQYREIVRIRIALEPVAAGLAAARITETEIAALHNRNESLSNAIDRGDFKAALEIDTGFHLALYEIADQPLLASMITSLLLRAGPTRTRLSGKYRKSRIGIAHHRSLLDALSARDADAASAAIAADLRDGSNAILSELAQ